MKILAMVLAGGNGTRLHPLTAEHAKPALRFAHGYRIVDFVPSKLVNSDISPIYVLMQYKPRSLVAHTVDAYRAAQRDVLGPLPRFNLVNPKWPIRGDAYRVRRRMVPPAAMAPAGTRHIAVGASANAPLSE